MANYKYYLKNIAKVSQDTMVLELANKNSNQVFGYQPGQYVMISYLNEAGRLNQRHAFSIASSPTQLDHLTLGVRVGGKFTQGLSQLPIGAPISVAGPYGKFVFKPKKHKNLVLLGGGIGITPFLSTMIYATDKQLTNKLTLLYSVRNLTNAVFLNDIKKLETNNHNLKTLVSLTNETQAINTPGIVSGRIDAGMIKNFVGDLNDKFFFLCGPEAFMQAMKQNLLSLGVAKNKIKMEAFVMIDDEAWWPQVKNLSYATIFSVATVATIFYSIAQADGLAKIKALTNQVVKPTDQSANSNYNQVAPSPMTSVSGMPSSDNTSTNNQINNNRNYSNQINKTNVAPTPMTSTSAPVNSVQNQTTNNNSNLPYGFTEDGAGEDN